MLPACDRAFVTPRGTQVVRPFQMRGASCDARPTDEEEMHMATQQSQPATNERIVQLLEEVKAQLADSKEREQQIARDLERLLSRG